MPSLDGKLLATDDFEGVVYIWDIQAEKELVRLKVEDDRHDPARFVDNGRILITYSQKPDDTIVLRHWDVATGKLLKTLPALCHKGAMCFSPDGETVALAMWTDPVRLVDTSTGQERCTLQGEKASTFQSLDFSPDGKTLATGYDEPGSTEAFISLWDTSRGVLVRRFSVPRRAATILQFAPDGRTLLTHSGNGNHGTCTLYFWDTVTGKRLLKKPAHEDEITSLAFTPDGRQLVSCADEEVRVWDVASGQHVREIPGHPGDWEHHGAFQVAVTADGQHVVSGGKDGCLRVRRLRDGHEERCFTVLPADRVRPNFSIPVTFVLRDDGRSVLAGQQMPTFDGSLVLLLDLTTGKEMARRFENKNFWYGPVSPNGRFIVKSIDAGPDPTAPPVSDAGGGTTPQRHYRDQVEELLTGRPGAALGPYPDATAGDFSPDGQSFARATCERDARRYPLNQALHLWEVASSQEYLVIRPRETGEDHNLTEMIFSPDGRTLATKRYDDVIQLWDITTGKELLRRAGYDAEVTCLAFSPDGKLLATGHKDTTILIWDVAAATRRSLKADRPLTKEELESCWADLAADARQAHVAIWKLVSVPDQAVPVLRDCLRPEELVPKERLRQLVTDLDSDEFNRREAAVKQLSDLEELAEPAMQQALKVNPTLEQRRRIEALLSAPLTVRSSEKLRHLRAIQVLEQIGDAPARKVLETLAKGVPEARVTKAATAALRRLARR